MTFCLLAESVPSPQSSLTPAERAARKEQERLEKVAERIAKQQEMKQKIEEEKQRRKEEREKVNKVQRCMKIWLLLFHVILATPSPGEKGAGLSVHSSFTNNHRAFSQSISIN